MGERVAPGSEDRDRLDRPATWPALATLALVVLVWLAAPRILPTLIGSADGAIYAALEALFSGLAFAGVVWTVLLQSRELALQRAELITTREEMARARAESARTASAQEDVARLAALTALFAHEDENVRAMTAIRSMPQPDGPGRRFRIGPSLPSSDDVELAQQRLSRLRAEVEAVHERMKKAPA